jgi:hypothetical protein
MEYLYIIIFSLIIFCGGYTFGIKKKQDEIYLKALEVFYIWKKEVGGCAFRGVGNIYEGWIIKKINELKNAKK